MVAKSFLFLPAHFLPFSSHPQSSRLMLQLLHHNCAENPLQPPSHWGKKTAFVSALQSLTIIDLCSAPHNLPPIIMLTPLWWFWFLPFTKLPPLVSGYWTRQIQRSGASFLYWPSSPIHWLTAVGSVWWCFGPKAFLLHRQSSWWPDLWPSVSSAILAPWCWHTLTGSWYHLYLYWVSVVLQPERMWAMVQLLPQWGPL